jgi:UDP-glucose 4-epimerase
MKKVLITGGAGFIGSHLTEELIQKGCQVSILDDLSTGSLQNMLPFRDNTSFRFTHGSILDKARVDEMVAACDEVYHLAAVVGVKLVVENPIRTITVNVNGTENVLEACLRHARKVLLASTSEVYGRTVNSTTRRFSETHDLSLGTSLRWGYACSKALDEYLSLAYAREQGLSVVIVRIFNTVGPRQTGAYGMVVPRLVQQALAGQNMTVYGDGLQTRSFLWIKDTITALRQLMETSAAVGQTFNIGSEEEVNINVLAALIKKVAGSPSAIVHIPYEQAYGGGFEDIRHRVPDTSKIRSAIGFQPTKTIRQIIEVLLQHHWETPQP